MRTKPWTMGIGKLANLTWSPAIIPHSLPLCHNRCYVPWRHCQLHKNGLKFVDNDDGDWRAGGKRTKKEKETRKKKKKKPRQSQHLSLQWRHGTGEEVGVRVCARRPLSRNRTYRYGNTPWPLPATITIVYTYTHTLVSCRPGAVWAQMVVNCITHLSVSGL